MKGAKPKPTKLHELTGGLKKHPERARPFEPDVPAEMPETPEWLDDFAKGQFERIGGLLLRHEIPTMLDQLALAGLADLVSLWRQLNELWNDPENKPLMIDSVVDSAGRERITAKKNPLFAMKMDVYLRLQPYLAMFGLNPAERSRLKVLPKKLEDDFEEFLESKKKGKKD